MIVFTHVHASGMRYNENIKTGSDEYCRYNNIFPHSRIECSGRLGREGDNTALFTCVVVFIS